MSRTAMQNELPLNWKGRLHDSAIDLSGKIISPLRKSAVSPARPVFIWGPSQAGTFLIYDLIASLGGFAYHSVQGFRKKGLADRPIGKKLFLKGYPNEGIVRFWSDCGLPYDHGGHWEFRGEVKGDALSNIDTVRVRDRYGRTESRWLWDGAGPLRILDKCPLYILMTEAIDRVFPDALHIFCTRDRQKIVASIVSRLDGTSKEAGLRGYPSGWYGNVFLPGYEAHEHSSLEERHLWQTDRILEIGHAAASRLKDRCLTIRHEDVLAAPQAEMEKIATFIEAAVPANFATVLREGVRKA